MLYLTGRALYGPAVGFWSAIVFDTLPGLSYSSLLITTDVPLILFWTIALYAWVMLVKRQSMGFAILLGVAIGFGLLAKQAMIYAFLCMACHAAVSREARQALRGGRLVVVVLLAFALFVPNVIWNAEHGFPPRQAYRRQHRLEAPIHSSPAAGPVFRAAVRGLRAHPVRRIAARKLARDPSRVRPGQGPAALLLVTGARAAMRPGADLARPRQLVGDRLSRGIDPRHGGDARAGPAHPIWGVSRPASRDRSNARRSARFRAANAAVRAAPVPVPRCRVARRCRCRARKIGARALWRAPRRYARDGRRAALLSARRAHTALCVAVRTFAERPVRDDPGVHRRGS
ncbi:MAG TPA: hypothetical protein DIC31_11225 [Rhizobiales bacterium]|nr:hypothetical protein [Hyphomicrobiales bacterium]